MTKAWQPYAQHVLDAIARIRRIQMRGDLAQDEVLYDAALRNLQTLSEATQALPDDKKAAHPQIPWREISGFRNILVHNYLGTIDPGTISIVMENYLEPGTHEKKRRCMGFAAVRLHADDGFEQEGSVLHGDHPNTGHHSGTSWRDEGDGSLRSLRGCWPRKKRRCHV